MSILIKGGRIIDETGVRDGDVRVADGVVTEVGEHLDANGDTVLDAAGCIVCPGFVDIHVHLRQPGSEEAETIESGGRAAALGGFTAVVAMANTNPVADNIDVVRQVQQLGSNVLCDVFPAAAITVGLAGEVLSPMGELSRAGVRLFTDDGKGVQNAGLMNNALEYAKALGVVLAQHCEVKSLSGGAMHEGTVSAELGVKGIPAEAEELMVARDIALVRKTGAQVHFMHMSTAGSVELIRQAKAEGLPVTAEVTPHHFTLTDESLRGFDANFKVHPPLRTQSHVDAVKQAIADGVIDAIATDHAPHAPHFKDMPLDEAPPGMLGLETALAVSLAELDIPIEHVVAMLSWQPARIAQIVDHGLPIAAGNAANITVFNPDEYWVVEADKLASLSRNTPYAGRKVKGRVRHTLLRGEPTVLNGEAQR